MTPIEAKSILNKYRNRYYNSSNQEEVELAKAIDVIFEHIKALDKPIMKGVAINGTQRNNRKQP